MSDVKLWAFSLCAAAVAVALVQMLAPKNQQKSLSLVANLFLLLTLLAPLSKIGQVSLPDLSDGEREAARAQENAYRLYSAEIERRLASAADEKLRALGIIADEIRIDISVSDAGVSIGMVTVILDGDDRADASQALAALEEYLGLPVCAGTNEGT